MRSYFFSRTFFIELTCGFIRRQSEKRAYKLARDTHTHFIFTSCIFIPLQQKITVRTQKYIVYRTLLHVFLL